MKSLWKQWIFKAQFHFQDSEFRKYGSGSSMAVLNPDPTGSETLDKDEEMQLPEISEHRIVKDMNSSTKKIPPCKNFWIRSD